MQALRHSALVFQHQTSTIQLACCEHGNFGGCDCNHSTTFLVSVGFHSCTARPPSQPSCHTKAGDPEALDREGAISVIASSMVEAFKGNIAPKVDLRNPQVCCNHLSVFNTCLIPHTGLYPHPIWWKTVV